MKKPFLIASWICLSSTLGFCQLENGFSEVRGFSTGLVVAEKDGKECIYDLDLQAPLTNVFYDEIQELGAFKENWAKVISNDKIGFIDDNGYELVAPQFDEVMRFGQLGTDIAAVRKGEKWGCIEGTGGLLVVQVKYDEIGAYGIPAANAMLVKKGKLVGCVDPLERIEMIPCEFESLKPAGGNDPELLIGEKKGKFGLVTAWGHELTNFKYDLIEATDEGEYRAELDGHSSLLDGEGHILEK